MTHEMNHHGIAFFEDGDQSAPALVLGHALGADHRIWDTAAEALKDDYHVIRWDLPGHGSSAALTEPYTVEHVTELLMTGLDELGVQDFHIAGISMGGMVSLSAAVTHPDRVVTLGILDAGPILLPHSAWTERAALVRAEGTEAIVEGTMERWFSEDFRLGEGAQVCAQVRDAYVHCNREGFARCCEVLAAADLRGELQNLTQKTLLLTGEFDEGMTPEDLARLAAQLPNAETSQVIVSDAKHLTCVQKPDVVTRALEELIA